MKTGVLANQPITYTDFFRMYFPRCGVVVADFARSSSRIALECIAEEAMKREPWTKETLEEFKAVNNNGYGIFFTPNALKEEMDGIHKLENHNWINACYTDIDIEDTKGGDFNGIRDIKKAVIAGRLWFAPLEPSYVIETRNGYQAYWFTSCSLEKFKKIQQGIYEHFEDIGADASAKKEVQLMRVPGFYHNKEKVLCKPFYEICARNSDGTLKYHKSDDLAEAFPVKENVQPKNISKVYKKEKSTMFKNIDDIFTKVCRLPQQEVLERLSGTTLVKGEKITFKFNSNGKYNVYCNGKISPVFVDPNLNMVFSNNATLATVIQFLEWYGWNKREMAEELKKIFK